MHTPADTVIVRIPRQEVFMPLLRMVLGGIASRKDLSFDALDDLQLAVDSIMAEDNSPEDLSMSVSISEECVSVRLEPLSDGDLRATLVLGQVPPEAKGRCIDVCLLLESLVDRYEIEQFEQGGYAVILEKTIA